MLYLLLCLMMMLFLYVYYVIYRGSKVEGRKLTSYNPILVYCRELAPGTVSLTGDRAQGDDSKHDSHYNSTTLSKQCIKMCVLCPWAKT